MVGVGDGVLPGVVGVGVDPGVVGVGVGTGVLNGETLMMIFGVEVGSGVGSEIFGLSVVFVGIGEAQRVLAGVDVAVGDGVALGDGVTGGAGVAGTGVVAV